MFILAETIMTTSKADKHRYQNTQLSQTIPNFDVRVVFPTIGHIKSIRIHADPVHI